MIGNPCKCVKPFDDQDRIYALRVGFIDEQLEGFAWVLVLTDLEVALDSPGQLLAKLPHEMRARGNAVRRDPNHGRTVVAAVRRKPEILCSPTQLSPPRSRPHRNRREPKPDLLWLLLWRIADVSSLIAEQAPQHFVLDQTLLELDDTDPGKDGFCHWSKSAF
jgi:hypothetical protein